LPKDFFELHGNTTQWEEINEKQIFSLNG